MRLSNPFQIHRAPRHDLSAMIALAAFGLGAAAMYFFDPASGRRRRAQVRDQMVHAGHAASDTASGAVQRLRHRAYGVAAETRAALRPRSTSIPESSASPMTK